MTTWACIGIYPHTPPCGATGTTDRDAEQHVKATKHGTSSGATARGVEAVVRACAERKP